MVDQGETLLEALILLHAREHQGVITNQFFELFLLDSFYVKIRRVLLVKNLEFTEVHTCLLHKFCCGLTNQCHVTERSLRSGAKGNVKVPSIFLGRDTADWSPLSDAVQNCIQITVLEVPLEPVTTVTICIIDAIEDVAEPFNAEKFVEESHLGFSVLLIRSHGHQDPLDIPNLLLVAAFPVGKRRTATDW